MINPKEKQCKYTLFEISKLIYGLAYVAMNSEIIEIPSESLKSKKKFKKIISNGEFANKYLPNTRFKSLVRRINDLMLKQKNYNIKDIVKELQVFYMDEHENLDYILNRPQLKYDEMSGYLNKAKSYVRKIYSSSKNFELINSFLEDLKIREISIEDLPQHCIPASFRKYEIVKSEYNDVLHVINKDIGILFYLGNVEYMDDFDTDLLYISSENMGRFKQYSNGDNNCCIYFDYTIKKQYIFNCNNSEMQELISNNNLVVVVNYKFFDAKTSKIIGIERCFNQIYVYCDRTYPNSIDIINSVCKNIAKCRIIEYGSTYLLIIKVSSKIKLILPFLSVAYERVLSDIRNKVLNLELADNPDGVTLFENYIIKQEDDLEVYDLIMNCFFDFE